MRLTSDQVTSQQLEKHLLDPVEGILLIKIIRETMALDKIVLCPNQRVDHIIVWQSGTGLSA